ncbi:transaldolase [Plasticicumulans lactativorans]|uniref:Transaldolase n=1 Tax=Plasticicumulans lactativorans TaxID=1133106 RepID=A0A4R2LCA5_9GAMM|nr:transaldolase [Plasticicumulans lactativorans]TCO81982.1 transaldolase [Plasticicumulans lactativorans]
MSRLRRIRELGQQVWLDNLSRELLDSGALARLIAEDGVAGVTSNPAIFYNAIAKGDGYGADLARVKARETDPERRFEALVLADIQAACDLLRPLYDETDGDMGYVSFEVSPRLAQNAAGTLAAARRLWAEIARPNAMIKIPATAACVPAVADAIADGINVNVTLIFSPRQLRDIFAAYRQGLERRAAAGQPVRHIRAVASVFISRVDALVDRLLPESAAHLRGTIAIAAAKDAYAEWQEIFGAARFAALRAVGARPQTLLWASTGTKNPAYRDVRYVEELIGPDTVDTVPDATLAAFIDHGEARATLAEGLAEARARLAELAALGLDRDALGEQLQAEGLKLFDEAFDKLLTLVA